MSYFIQYMQLASQSIYWLAPLFISIYIFFTVLNKLGVKILSPTTATIIFGLLAFITFPTIPKYKFESDVRAEFENASEFKLVYTSSAVSMTEILAFFSFPTTYFQYVAPMGPPSAEPYLFNSASNKFQEFTYEYGKEPKLRMIDARCNNYFIGFIEPVDGLMRYAEEREMFPTEKKYYCETDYTYENNIAFCKLKIILKQTDQDMNEEQLEVFLVDANSRCKDAQS